MTTRFVPVCKGCAGGACFGIGLERRDFAKNDWWCGRCIPPALATWRKPPFETQPAAAPQGEGIAREAPKQFAGGLF